MAQLGFFKSTLDPISSCQGPAEPFELSWDQTWVSRAASGHPNHYSITPCASLLPVDPVTFWLNDNNLPYHHGQVLDRLHAKEENCKNLQTEIEDQHRKVSVIRHQMGLLYEEFHAEKKSWKIGQSELENTIRFRFYWRWLAQVVECLIGF